MMVGEEVSFIFVADLTTSNPLQVSTNEPTTAPAITSSMMILSLLSSDFIPFVSLPTTIKKKKDRKNQFAGIFLPFLVCVATGMTMTMPMTIAKMVGIVEEMDAKEVVCYKRVVFGDMGICDRNDLMNA